MLRRLFTAAAIISLLLCMATLLLWITSYRRILTADRFRHITSRDIDRSQIAGKIGAFNLTILRGRCEVDIEMDSAYLDDDGKWHFSQAPTFGGIGDIEVKNGPSNALWSGGRTPVYRVYFNHAAFAIFRNDLNDISRDYCVIFPLWFIVVLTAIPPGMWARLRMKSGRRARNGFCLSCGYDLRASTGRCPECGAVCKAADPDPDALAAEFASRNVELSQQLKDTHDGLRGFELKDADGYVLFFGRPRG